jgi:hypothetical protein
LKEFLERGCQGKFFSLRRRRGYFPRRPAPLAMKDARLGSCPWDWVCVVPSQWLHLLCSSDDADRFLKPSKPCGCTVSTMDLSEARGLVLFWVIRGSIGITRRLGAKGHPCLQALRILTLEPERLKNRLATTRRRSPEMEGSSPETLKRLAILVFGVEAFLLLPQSQRNRCNLARQRETRHRRLYTFREQYLVEVLERSGTHTGHGGRTFEQTF